MHPPLPRALYLLAKSPIRQRYGTTVGLMCTTASRFIRRHLATTIVRVSTRGRVGASGSGEKRASCSVAVGESSERSSGNIVNGLMDAGSAKYVGQGSVYVFFFQAEDGIRDLTVTGVQTCALPI